MQCISDEVTWNQINHEDLKGSNNNNNKRNDIIGDKDMPNDEDL